MCSNSFECQFNVFNVFYTISLHDFYKLHFKTEIILNKHDHQTGLVKASYHAAYVCCKLSVDNQCLQVQCSNKWIMFKCQCQYQLYFSMLCYF